MELVVREPECIVALRRVRQRREDGLDLRQGLNPDAFGRRGIRHADKPLKNLAATVENEFCSLLLSSLDDKPIAQADRLFLVATARAANTGMKWNDKRTSLTDWGTEPSVIEPVKGFVTLKGITSVRQIEVVPLDSGAKRLGQPVPAETTPDGCHFRIGEPATPWYLVCIGH
jgi:hypothetical protein